MDLLQVLDCFNNFFSGPLPPDLWKISTLQHVSLGGNYFDGSIPLEYGRFPNLKYLGLNGNSLTGAIPAELGNLTGNALYIFTGAWIKPLFPQQMSTS